MQNQFITLSSWPRAILHIDCDAFFASCEQALHPQYRGKPVITGKERGIVAAASYEAKALGIKRGVSLWDVKKICKDAIILPSDYETYSLFSKRVFAVIRRFTPIIEEYSIDEAFADITGYQRPYNTSYITIALRIKDAIESETGLTVSVGLSLSKVLAKIGSKYQKPAGFTPIPGKEIHKYLAVTPIGKIWGIGGQTMAYCKSMGIETALDYAQKDEDFIKKKFTKPHYEIWQELNGHKVYGIETEDKTTYATISKTKTFTPASDDKAYVFAQLTKNMENACIKARRHNLVAKGIIVFLRKQDYKTVGMEANFSRPTAFPSDMVKILRTLFGKIFRTKNLYRATGVVLTGLRLDEGVQMSLFEPAIRIEDMKRIYAAVDELSVRFGKHSVYTGAGAFAQNTPQHVYERGDVPVRKLSRLKGESKRKHLPIPMLHLTP
jgi:DNA polymerase-4/DNA polymerase V